MTTSLGHRRAAALLAGLVLGAGLAGCGLPGSSGGDTFCDRLQHSFPAYRTQPLEALGADAGASEWKAYFDVSHQRNAALLTGAPDELKAALTSVQATNDQLAVFYADAEYNPRQVDAGALSQLMDDAGYQRSVATLRDYAQHTCHADTGSVAPPASS